MNIKKIVAAFTAAAALVVSAPFAALPNATASAASADGTENTVSSVPADALPAQEDTSSPQEDTISAQADITVGEENYRIDFIAATAKVGDTELAADKIIVNGYGGTVVVNDQRVGAFTLIVPDNTTPEQISATITFNKIKTSDGTVIPVSITKGDLKFGGNDVSVPLTEGGEKNVNFWVYVVKEKDFLNGHIKNGSVTATAKVGDTELASDKVVVNEKGYSVTIVVPNNTTPEQISATISLTVVTYGDGLEIPLSKTRNDLQWGQNYFFVNKTDDGTGWGFYVYVVKEEDYKESTVHFSVEMIGFDEGETHPYAERYIFTTQRQDLFDNSNLDYALALDDGDKVNTGTTVYIVRNRECSSKDCSTGLSLYDDEGKHINFYDTVVQTTGGRTFRYWYFFVPENGVNICETHTKVYNASFTINNHEQGTIKRVYGDGSERDIWDLQHGDGKHFSVRNAVDFVHEYSLTPDEGYSAVMTVKDADGNVIPVIQGEKNSYSFKQPAKEVTVTIDFVKISKPDTDDSSDTSTSTPDSSDTSTSTPDSSDTSTSTPDSSDTSTGSTSAVGTIDDTPTSSDTSASAPAVTEKEFKPTITETNLSDEQKRVLGSITVTDTNGAFDDDVVMNIAPGQSENRLFSFNITFIKNGQEVQPKNSVTVKVPVPEALKDKKIYVFHNENGRKVLVNSEVKDGFVIFSADHFSEYILSADNLAETGSTETTASTNTPSNNPDTGVAVAAVPVVIAVSAAVIIISKKKK